MFKCNKVFWENASLKILHVFLYRFLKHPARLEVLRKVSDVYLKRLVIWTIKIEKKTHTQEDWIL